MAEARALSLGRRILQFEITAKKIKPLHLMSFCRYLSVFLSAGVPILDALEILRADTPDKTLKRCIGDMVAALQVGDNFTQAVATNARAFPRFFISMIRAAETTGELDVVLGQLAKYIERDLEARRKVRNAMAYPLVVVALSVVVVGVMSVFVLPKFQDFFADFDAELPLPTRMLIGLTGFVVADGLKVFIALIAIVVVAIAATHRGKGRLLRDRLILKIPQFGAVIRYNVVERFCRILAAMVQAAVALPDALDIAAEGTTNRHFKDRLLIAKQEMIEGEGVYVPLNRTELFPPAAVQMIRVGEETGSLDVRLEEVARFYAQELEYKLKKLTDLLEPAAIIVVGLMVGFVSIALVSAIYGLYGQIS